MAVLVNPANATNAEATLRDVEAAARAMGLQIQVLNASTSREIDAAFATLARERPDALFVGTDAFFNSRRVQLANLAARHAVPATYAAREFAEIGGLMSYGTNIDGCLSSGRRLYRPHPQGRQAGGLAGGAGDQFELVINAQTARMLGLAVPPTLLAARRRGDRVTVRRARGGYLNRVTTRSAHHVVRGRARICLKSGQSGHWAGIAE